MSAPALAPPPVPPAPASPAWRAWRAAHERRAAARNTYLAAWRHGETLTGAQLATRYGMSERWGRARIAEARPETDNGGCTVPAQPDNGSGTSSPLNGTHPSAEPTRGSMPVLPASGNGAGRHKGTLPATAQRNGDGRAGMPFRGSGTGGAGHNGMTAVAVNDGTQRTHGDAGGRLPTAAPATVPETSTAQRRLMSTAVVVVAAVAATASYDHQRAVAGLAGEGWRSWLLPLSVDGPLTAATMLMLTRRRAGQPAGALTWTALALGIVTSVAANVVGADPTLADPKLVSRLVAAWPPLALFLSLELLMRQLGDRQDGSVR